jgi:hypothetical protein
MESIWEVDIAGTRARTRRKVKGKKKGRLQRYVHGRRRRRRETKKGELGSE